MTVALDDRVFGEAVYVCPFDDTEWTARAFKDPGNIDPRAVGRGDDCPTCGRECDQCIEWAPDWVDVIALDETRSPRKEAEIELSPAESKRVEEILARRGVAPSSDEQEGTS